MKIEKHLHLKFTRIGTEGYLVVPRALLNEVLRVEQPFTLAQAYLYLFVHAAFCDKPVKGGLKRGQLTFTAAELAEIFHWTPRSVRRFLYVLREMGVVELEVVPGLRSKLTMCFYEALTGGKGKQLSTNERKECYSFWRKYYGLLDREATDYYATTLEWERLTQEERRLAMENMLVYFRSLNNIQFVKSAPSYLKYKAFLMPENIDDYLKTEE